MGSRSGAEGRREEGGEKNDIKSSPWQVRAPPPTLFYLGTSFIVDIFGRCLIFVRRFIVIT
jgi:hypothetical protein